MSPAETAGLLRYLESLPRNISLVIIEHDVDIVFSLAERILVLNFGEVLADGLPEEIHKDERVQAAYLGVG
jgi:branched-chain amino acid transport system ATP-binding protein